MEDYKKLQKEIKIKWKEYILNNVSAYEVVELFFDLKIDDDGDIIRIPESKEEGSQIEFRYECSLCGLNIESKKLLKKHFQSYHLN